MHKIIFPTIFGNTEALDVSDKTPMNRNILLKCRDIAAKLSYFNVSGLRQAELEQIAREFSQTLIENLIRSWRALVT